MANSDKQRSLFSFLLSIFCFLLSTSVHADAPLFDEEPFAKEETQTPAERLRKILAKMNRVREDLARAARQEGTPPQQGLRGITRRQKEVEEELARLVLVLQKG